MKLKLALVGLFSFVVALQAAPPNWYGYPHGLPVTNDTFLFGSINRGTNLIMYITDFVNWLNTNGIASGPSLITVTNIAYRVYSNNPAGYVTSYGTNASYHGAVVVNVLDYGAKPSPCVPFTDTPVNYKASNDCTVAINAAVTAAANSGGYSNVVYFPPGIYPVSNTWYVPYGVGILGSDSAQNLGASSSGGHGYTQVWLNNTSNIPCVVFAQGTSGHGWMKNIGLMGYTNPVAVTTGPNYQFAPSVTYGGVGVIYEDTNNPTCGGFVTENVTISGFRICFINNGNDEVHTLLNMSGDIGYVNYQIGSWRQNNAGASYNWIEKAMAPYTNTYMNMQFAGADQVTFINPSIGNRTNMLGYYLGGGESTIISSSDIYYGAYAWLDGGAYLSIQGGNSEYDNGASTNLFIAFAAGGLNIQQCNWVCQNGTPPTNFADIFVPFNSSGLGSGSVLSHMQVNNGPFFNGAPITYYSSGVEQSWPTFLDRQAATVRITYAQLVQTNVIFGPGIIVEPTGFNPDSTPLGVVTLTNGTAVFQGVPPTVNGIKVLTNATANIPPGLVTNGGNVSITNIDAWHTNIFGWGGGLNNNGSGSTLYLQSSLGAFWLTNYNTYPNGAWAYSSGTLIGATAAGNLEVPLSAVTFGGGTYFNQTANFNVTPVATHGYQLKNNSAVMSEIDGRMSLSAYYGVIMAGEQQGTPAFVDWDSVGAVNIATGATNANPAKVSFGILAPVSPTVDIADWRVGGIKTQWTDSNSVFHAAGFVSTAPHTPVAATVGASPFNFTNTTPAILKYRISGATAYSVTVDGVAVFGSLAGDIADNLSTNEWITITYTVAPTLYTNSW